MMTTPICDFIQSYNKKDFSRFHMPGHKGNDTLASPYDITEVSGADALYEADGIIAESEANASELFGTAMSCYSTEGSSQVIRAMLSLAKGYYLAKFQTACHLDRPSTQVSVLAARNVHRAFLTAAALLDLDVSWIFSEQEPFTLCSCPVTAAQVERAILSQCIKPAAVYLTSPDYLGNIQDISGISSVCHKYDIPLLVDNAHGAYLHFLDTPLHPMDLGADLCCDSAHKTLPALTGCAYLHINSNSKLLEGSYLADFSEYCTSYAKRMLSMFGSTSPSYLQLASLDRTNLVLSTSWREDIKKCIHRIDECKNQILKLGLSLYGDEPMKITIHCSKFGYTGNELAAYLRKCKIECEYADPDYLVLMPSPYNSEEDFIKLKHALSDLPLREALPQPSFPKMIPAKACSIKEAAFGLVDTISIENAAGCICADLALACPPAVPIVVCGEVISEDFLPIMKHYKIAEIKVRHAAY